MAGYQKMTIIGNLGSDPEMRYTPAGQAVTNFRVAVNNRRIDTQTGEAHQTTAWFRVSVWGAQAESCNKYLAKGREVHVEGQMTFDPETGGPRIWIGQDGKPHASFEMRALQVTFLGGGRGDNGGGNQVVEDQGLTEDEIPF